MAIIKNNLSMMMKGKVGAFSYYVADTRQVVRQAQNNSNYGENATRTVKQQERRVTWANLVNFYSGNKSWMKKAFESLKPGVSVYNRFIQLNINQNKIALTKSEAQAKIWVVQPYRVTQGSLPTSMDETGFPTYEALHAVDGTANTVGTFSRTVIQKAPDYQNGDAIVCVRFYGTYANPTMRSPKTASYEYLELVLDTSSTEELPDWITHDSSSNVYSVNTDALNSADAWVFIHTRLVGGQLLVSTEDIFNNSEIASYWTDDAQKSNAIASYGQFEVVPLEPGGSTTSGTGNDSSSGSGGSGDSGGDDGDLGD